MSFEDFAAGAVVHTTTLDDRRAPMTVMVKRDGATGLRYVEYRVSKFERRTEFVAGKYTLINAWQSAIAVVAAEAEALLAKIEVKP